MLDLFFKKYAWTANLVLIFAAAWLTARTVNTVLGAAIRPRPAIDFASIPAQPARPPAPTQLDVDRLYHLVGSKPPPPPAPEEQPGQPQAKGPQNCHDRGATPVKSGLRAQLVAGVVSDRPRSSIASIIDLNTRETRVYGVGDALMGAQVLSVERLRDDKDATGTGFKVVAIVCNDGRKEFVDFEPGDGSSAARAPVMAAVAPRPGGEAPEADAAAADGVKKLENNKYEIKRTYIDNALGNLNNIATQARIVPSFKNGVANGFKLFSIQPGSLYSAIGVENGDVIQRINGYEMNSPDKALEVYQKLKDASHITIELERNGQIVRKEYNVTGS
ncbi:MAG TPA: type II secretion system protein GspC [Anaeromyxobacteraceae bacterium]|nr:type II secretion system protein GspC [Anaeromyxobacteraceae bacterium]